MSTERTTSPRIHTFDAAVIEAVHEAPDTTTLVLDVGPHNGYKAGQYVSVDPYQFAGLRGFAEFLERLKGRHEVPRAYSMCSAPHEPHVAITIKEEHYIEGATPYPPLLSGFLTHRIHAGDRMVVTGFAGAYVFPDDVETRADHILHVCAGSGSVPNFSMIKDSLHRHARLRHTFIYSNKTWQEIIFRDALTALCREHPDRLRVIHALTRETGTPRADADVRHGRITPDLLQTALTTEPNSLIYICGPAISVWERRAAAAQGIAPTPRFLESMLAQLNDLGVPKSRIKVESYG
jgi:ferredoxin-NADP reductase